MSDTAPHLLVVDDDARLLSLLQRFLSQEGYRVTTAASAAEARARFAAIAFDLVVLDVMMPGESGLDLTRALRDAPSPGRSSVGGQGRVPVLLLTAMGETHDRIAGLEAGADDYLGKPFEPKELALRIRAILARALAPPPARPQPLLRFGPFAYDSGRDLLLKEGEPVRLSGGEAALLRALAEFPGVAVSREDLARRGGGAGGGEGESGPRAVDVQVTRLRRKLEADPREPRHLLTVRGAGYMLRLD